MTTRYTILPAASDDLDELAAYLAQEASMELAFRFYDAADATFQQIARMPGLGERRESVNPRLAGLRVWRIEGFANHLVFYRPSDDGIDIIRVLHGSRDIDSVLDADSID